MKVKVVNRFVDKETRQLHEYGEVIEVTEARFKEISAAGKYVEAVAEEPEEKPEEKPLDKMKVDELKEYAKAHEIELGEAKTKAEILEAIKAAEAAEGAEGAEGAE